MAEFQLNQEIRIKCLDVAYSVFTHMAFNPSISAEGMDGMEKMSRKDILPLAKTFENYVKTGEAS